MGVNKAEQGINQALVDEVRQIRQDLDQLRTNPQEIGAGSLNIAWYGPDGWSWSGVTVAAGRKTVLITTLAVNLLDSAPAYDRVTLMNVFVDVSVDVNDADHHFPYGSALTFDQQQAAVSVWYDLAGSGLSTSDGGGQRSVYIEVTNNSTASHTYFVRGNAILPFPALKKL